MAQSVIGALRVELGIDTAAFDRGLEQAQGRLNSIGKSMEDVGKRMQGIGKRMSTWVTAPIVGIGAASLKMAGDFEQAMNEVAALSGATGDELDQLRTKAREMGAATMFSASEAAEAMGFLAMAGFDTNEILAAIPGTLQLAASAQMDLGRAADIVSNILTGYNKTTEDLAHVNDVLVKAFTSANTNLEQLGEAMKYAGPVAASAGVQFEEAAAAISLMGNAGIQGSMAGTSLRGALSRILSPTTAVTKAMEEAGLSFTDAQGRVIPLADIIEQLGPHAENTGLFMELFGQRAGPAMAALVSQGSAALRDLTAELEDSAGTAQRIGDVQMQGFNGAMREMKSAIEGLMIAIAESGLIEFMADLVRHVTSFVRVMSETNPEILKWGTIIAGAAAAIGPLVLGLGTLVAGIGAVIPVVTSLGVAITGLIAATGPIGLFIAATGAIIAAWTIWGDDIRELIGGTVEWIGEVFTGLYEKVLGIWTGMTEGIKGVWEGFTGFMAESMEAVTTAISDGWQWLSDTVVGNSIIPDMLDMMIEEFSRKHGIIVGDTAKTVDTVAGQYDRMARDSVSVTRRMAGEMGNLMQAMFGQNKAFAIAQAIISTYQGVAQALRDVPFPANLAAAAAVAAKGFAQVAGIRSTSISGGGGGGDRGGTPSMANTAMQQSRQHQQQQQAPQQRTVNLNIVGDVFDQKTIRNLAEQINEFAEDGFRLTVRA